MQNRPSYNVVSRRILDFPVQSDFPSSTTKERVDFIFNTCHETAKQSRGKDYKRYPVVSHNDAELYLLYDLARGVYDNTPKEGYIVQCGVPCVGSACVLAAALIDSNQEKYVPVFAVDHYRNHYAYVETHINLHKLELRKFLYLGVGNDTVFIELFWERQFTRCLSIQVTFTITRLPR